MGLVWTILVINMIFSVTSDEKRGGGENMFLLLSAPEKEQPEIEEKVGFEQIESADSLWDYLALLAKNGGKQGAIFAEPEPDKSEETQEEEEEVSSELDDHDILKRFFIHDILADDSPQKYVTYSAPTKRSGKAAKKMKERRKEMRVSEGIHCPNPEIFKPSLPPDSLPRRGKRYPDHLDPIMRYRLLARSGDCPRSEGGQRLYYCPSPGRDNHWRCIDDFQLCDGVVNCPNGEDEMPVPCLFYQVIQTQFTLIKHSIAGQQKPKPFENEIPQQPRSSVRKKLIKPSAALLG